MRIAIVEGTVKATLHEINHPKVRLVFTIIDILAGHISDEHSLLEKDKPAVPLSTSKPNHVSNDEKCDPQ